MSLITILPLLMVSILLMYIYVLVKGLKKQMEQIASLLESSEQICERQRKGIKKYRRIITNRIDDMKKLMDILCLSGQNNTLFLKKVTGYVRVNTGNPKNMFRDIQEVADLSGCGLIAHLKKQYPDLTENDLILCSLICLDFPSDSIAAIFGYRHEHSLYIRRHRLIKKLGLNKGDGIDLFIKEQIRYLQSHPDD